MDTVKQWAVKALSLQDACNSSGVAHTLVEWLTSDTCRQVTTDTTAKNRHPVTVLIIAKLADLAGMEYEWPTVAYEWCQQVAGSTEAM